ncbi:hypothetical protein P43SY_006473 [Pythium insidiosum]|uniref:AAA+ ATPase domain-containing protein n=1 Tax=Pythium insidiosum TaxID=114742 RepID=A0AAD5LD01_PYTIN|nr:hypothetical protein P43SY_006473 [Pythium insidiosum]
MSAACPICSRHFRQDNLALHVEFCLERSASAEKKRKRVEPATASPLGRPAPASQANTPRLPPRSSATDTASDSHDGGDVSDEARASASAPGVNVPLAERMRPRDLGEFVGQDELIGPGKLLATLIQSDRVPNMILWGPPGCGKTTLASIISRHMRDAIERARGEKKLLRRHTIVFVDEIHRFKKNQQDFFLPPVEDGTITLIGATTENPSFEINNALLSRSPHLVEQAVAAYHAAHYVGMPECDVVLAQCATLLARAPKSVEVYKAYKRVKATIHEWDQGAQPDVPLHLRNAPTTLMKNLGFGKDYKYNPDYTPEETKDQTYLPAELVGVDFFTPPPP